jgi:alkyl hydroperoxide reductase subunit AhpC
MVQVGKNAPQFSAQAYLNGNFQKVNLSDYANQWVLLFFYPGDFTFV